MRQSPRGYAILFHTSFFTWCSYKQRRVATSITETEYILLSECVQALRHHRQVLSELGKVVKASVVHNDCQLCIERVCEYEKRAKHIDVQYHNVCRAVLNEETKLSYCPTTRMFDILIYSKGRLILKISLT